MTLFGATSQGKVIILNDTAGTDKFEVKDADDFPVFRVDSKGNTYQKGKTGGRI